MGGGRIMVMGICRCMIIHERSHNTGTYRVYCTRYCWIIRERSHQYVSVVYKAHDHSPTKSFANDRIRETSVSFVPAYSRTTMIVKMSLTYTLACCCTSSPPATPKNEMDNEMNMGYDNSVYCQTATWLRQTKRRRKKSTRL